MLRTFPTICPYKVVEQIQENGEVDYYFAITQKADSDLAISVLKNYVKGKVTCNYITYDCFNGLSIDGKKWFSEGGLNVFESTDVRKETAIVPGYHLYEKIYWVVSK